MLEEDTNWKGNKYCPFLEDCNPCQALFFKLMSVLKFLFDEEKHITSFK